MLRQLFVPVLLFLVCSCSTSGPDALWEHQWISLVHTEKALTQSGEVTRTWLHEKTFEAPSAGRAGKWYPVQQQIDSLSGLMKDDIGRMQLAITRVFPTDSLAAAWRRKRPSLQRLPESQCDSLALRLEQCAKQLLSVASELPAAFRGLDFVNASFQPAGGAGHDLAFLKAADPLAQLLYLQQLRVNVQLLSNGLQAFCSEQVGMLDTHREELFAALVAQNVQVLEPGATLEITAGLGAFSTRTQPEVRFGSELSPLSVDGLARYELRVPMQPGHYRLPVSIRFTDAEGRKQQVVREVEYEVSGKYGPSGSTIR